MRVSSRVAVGSPTMRLAPLAISLILLLVISVVALGAGTGLLDSDGPDLPEPYGPAGNGVIAFSDGSDILAADADGQDPKVLVAGRETDTDPRFSHDGTQLAFLRDPDGKTGSEPTSLMVAAADGSDVRELLSPAEELASIDWSPDGRTIALARPRETAITLVDVENGGVRDLSVGDGELTGWLAWRPPLGEELLFLTQEGGNPRMHLYAIGPDGGGQRLIARGDDLSFDAPMVSSDGSVLTYWNWETNGRGDEDGWGHVLDLATGEDQPLSEFPVLAGRLQGPGGAAARHRGHRRRHVG